jgi:hypothetical protein
MYIYNIRYILKGHGAVPEGKRGYDNIILLLYIYYIYRHSQTATVAGG